MYLQCVFVSAHANVRTRRGERTQRDKETKIARFGKPTERIMDKLELSLVVHRVASREEWPKVALLFLFLDRPPFFLFISLERHGLTGIRLNACARRMFMEGGPKKERTRRKGKEEVTRSIQLN